MEAEVPKDSIDGWIQQGAGWWVYPLTRESKGFPLTMEYVPPTAHSFGYSILFQNSIIKMHTDPLDLELVCIERVSEGAWFITGGKVYEDSIYIPKGTEWGQMNMTENSVISLYYFFK
jgi:hypothetical protein